jgi:membrane protease YdiL (CAAX protease family)
VAGYGPLLAAVLLTSLTSGWSGLKDLGARLVRWRVSPRWYLVVLLTPLLFQGVGLFFFSLVSGQPITLAPDRLPWLELLAFFPLLFLGFDGLGEEVGWRGFALPGLLARHSPLVSSLILGVLWGFWHLGYALAPGGFLSETSFYLVVVNTVGLAILHTWIFAHVRGSIFIAILFHAWNNILSVFLGNWVPIYSQQGANLSILVVQYLLAAAVVLFAHPFRLARKRAPLPTEPQPNLLDKLEV